MHVLSELGAYSLSCSLGHKDGLPVQRLSKFYPSLYRHAIALERVAPSTMMSVRTAQD